MSVFACVHASVHEEVASLPLSCLPVTSFQRCSTRVIMYEIHVFYPTERRAQHSTNAFSRNVFKPHKMVTTYVDWPDASAMTMQSTLRTPLMYESDAALCILYSTFQNFKLVHLHRHLCATDMQAHPHNISIWSGVHAGNCSSLKTTA